VVGGSGGSGATSGTGGSGGTSGTGGSGAVAGDPFLGPQNPACSPLGTPADPGMYPQTTFDPQPAYIPSDVIVLTLDDGPDGIGCGGQSCTILDSQFFLQIGIKADFFINTENRCPVQPMFGCYTYAQQLIGAGHFIANHTVHHYHLAPGGGSGDGIMHCSDVGCVDAELSGVEQTVSALTNGMTPHLTRFRAPFGEPYQSGTPADLALVQPVVARYAVEINWNFDSGDSNGTAWDGVSLFNNVTNLVKTPGKGAWGIVLMHSVYQWTNEMLPLLIPYLRHNGFRLGTVEDVICWRFGKHSWQLIPGRSPN
jgi:peptidoglycan/xylan/chitin deacetylase (PgdA/CDA1 family)